MAVNTSVKFRLEHALKDQLELACDRYNEAQCADYSQEQIMRLLVRRFCVDQGIRPSLTERRKRPPRSGGT